jgi:hypothetical protein
MISPIPMVTGAYVGAMQHSEDLNASSNDWVANLSRPHTSDTATGGLLPPSGQRNSLKSIMRHADVRDQADGRGTIVSLPSRLMSAKGLSNTLEKMFPGPNEFSVEVRFPAIS